jgi:cyclic beta-1,2-glucan synthetase
MYRVALESILGLKLIGGDTLQLQPCIPDAWPGFCLRYRLPDGKTLYEIRVDNPEGRAKAVISAACDGLPATIEARAAWIPLRQDGTAHQVQIIVGDLKSPP